MSQYVVAISIDKVQSFLYYALQAYIQENQANSGTLKEIVNSSNLISRNFYYDIGIEGDQGQFSGHITDELLVCSGMCIFTTSLDRDQNMVKLDWLFRKYYESFKGQLLLKYICFERDILTGADKLKAIEESKRRLRQKDCLNGIIARQHGLLFQFCSDPDDDLKPNVPVYPEFSHDINALFSEEESDNDNHFRIAVIKADLDGMGDLFEKIDKYPVYKAVSELLSRVISLDALHNMVRVYKDEDSGFKLYPLYMAGDDIFFAVAASRLLDGVKICKDILRQLNNEIIELNSTHNTALPPLSMSVGVDFTFNREPIRYYYERVQRQVDCAKASSLKRDGKTVKASHMKVCINDYVFYDYEKDKRNKLEKSSWSYFNDDVKLLKGAMQKGFAAHHFFYSLLNKITDHTINSSEVKYSNAVLYHVLPEHMESGNEELRRFELAIVESLLIKLLVKKRKHSRSREEKSNRKYTEKELCFGQRQRKRLETYVRLLLLFSDLRFGITGREETIKGFKLDKKTVKRIRSTLFNKTMRYLYKHSLYSKDGNLRKIFVELGEYKAPNGSNKRVQVYRTLRISSSMFHRLKRIDINNNIEMAAKMIQSVNDETKEDIEMLQAERKKEKKAPPGLFFDDKAFYRIARQTNLWAHDYIDSLLIFYRFKELSIKYKSIDPSKKHNVSGGTRT